MATTNVYIQEISKGQSERIKTLQLPGCFVVTDRTIVTTNKYNFEPWVLAKIKMYIPNGELSLTKVKMKNPCEVRLSTNIGWSGEKSLILDLAPKKWAKFGENLAATMGAPVRISRFGGSGSYFN